MPSPTEREIDGAAFVSLSREDIALIYPNKGQFLLGSKLYREVQNYRQPTGSLGSSSDADFDSSFSETTSISTPKASRPSSSTSSVAKRAKTVLTNFSLPKFSPDVARAIKEDSFYTATIRNKLIREACRALKGYSQSPSGAEKRALGKRLHSLAPKSLGDPDGLAVAGIPEVL